MANKKPAHTFPKGNKFGGRKPLPDDLKKAINQGKEQLCRDVLSIRGMSLDEVKKYQDDKKTKGKLSLGEMAIITAYIKSDHSAIKIYEDRVFGKAQETHEVTGDLNITNFADWIKSVNAS